MAMSLTAEDKQWIQELLTTSLEASELRYREQLERVETRLLTEFHKWASPFEARLRSHAAALRAQDLEAEAIIDRLKKLESERPSSAA